MCHAPHVSGEAKLLRSKEPALCLDCHSEVGDALKDAKHKHAPVEASCVSCHKPHGADNPLMLAATAPKLCNDCHEEISTKVTEAKCKHSPAAAEGGCMICHAAHTSAADKLLKGDKPAKACLSCHDEEIKVGGRKLLNVAAHLAKNPHAHGPIGDGSCMPCHEPHGSERSGLLAKAFPDKFYAAYSEDAYGLCFDCHEAEAFATAKGGDTGFRNGETNLHYLHVHKEFKGRTCKVCHDPHASTNDKHIRESAPFGQWVIPIQFQVSENGGSCGPGCHQSYRYDRTKPVSNVVR
jgi:predicted CXXCH cytochrome family protein